MKKEKFLFLILTMIIGGLNTQSCKDACGDIVCENGGNCVDGNCLCQDGFSGENCEIFDPCFGLICKNGGSCEDGSCICLDAYTGKNCELFNPKQVQSLLDGNTTPLEIVNGGVLVDSLYGKRYQGGLIFHLNTSDGTGLISANEDQIEFAPWGCNFETIGAFKEEVGGGVINTMDIIAGCDEAGIAAKICTDLELNGYDDWFLPSIDELDLMWRRLADSDSNGENINQDDPNNLGRFSTTGYHSSTEVGSTYMKIIGFRTGVHQSEYKGNAVRVRAVRAF